MKSDFVKPAMGKGLGRLRSRADRAMTKTAARRPLRLWLLRRRGETHDEIANARLERPLAAAPRVVLREGDRLGGGLVRGHERAAAAVRRGAHLGHDDEVHVVRV